MGGLLQQVRDQPPQLLVLIGIQVNKFNANSKRCDIPHGRLRPDGICPGQNFNLQRFAHGGQILRFKERPADGQVPHRAVPRRLPMMVAGRGLSRRTRSECRRFGGSSAVARLDKNYSPINFPRAFVNAVPSALRPPGAAASSVGFL